ncbi:MAG: M20/M25/M40 family metallo-hydrolase, partial [Pyrinomonadaceae bacterium]
MLGVFVLYAFLLPTFSFAQTTAKSVYTAPKSDIDKIRDEGMKRSQVMQTLSYLTDVIGPRLTNSPNMKRANEWTRDTMAKWGMQNAKLESWGPFGRGWALKNFLAEVVEPQTIPVIAYPKAWSPSTNGAVTADVIHFDAKTDSDLDKFKGKLAGKIVLSTADMRELKTEEKPLASRRSDEDLKKMAAETSASRPQTPPSEEDRKKQREQTMFNLKRSNFLLSEKPVVVIDSSFRGSGGTVFVQGAGVVQPMPENGAEFNFRNSLQAYKKESESRMLPQMTMANEDYNRLVRMIKQGVTPRMIVNIQAQYYDDDLMGYNTVAEIPGTDPTLKEELVMLGGHLDSWQAATGATDNAAGCAVAMEAVRILIATRLKPRRTIRVALWSGEEQGLNGSREYVKQQFGEMKNARTFGPPDPNAPKPELIKTSNYDKLSA